MIFETGNLYHIYNQGNNRQKIFYVRDNYLYFLKKLKRHFLPHSDILAWCLMPNHFHLLVYVKYVFIPAFIDVTDGVTPSHPVSNRREISLNENIGIMLRSYARAVNKQEQRVGALFREETKAECLTFIDGITPSFYDTSSGTLINISDSEKEYPQICFDYIHFNPVSARLTQTPEEWEFSSFRDYCGIRNGLLINRERTMEFGIKI
jgi:putative transposase